MGTGEYAEECPHAAVQPRRHRNRRHRLRQQDVVRKVHKDHPHLPPPNTHSHSACPAASGQVGEGVVGYLKHVEERRAADGRGDIQRQPAAPHDYC